MKRDHKNVLVLGTCQMLFGTGRSLFMVAAPALAIATAPHLALATLPTGLVIVGTAASAMPASLFTRRVGRKAGFLAGTVIATLSGIACAAAVVLQSFWLLSLGGLLFGLFSGFAQLYRFAVADAASADFRARAISLVLAGGVFAAFAGPNLATFGKDLIESQVYVGGFLFLIATALIAALVLMFLDIPNLTKEQAAGPQRPMMEIMKQPAFITAALSATVAQCVMNFLMTATPVAMIALCNYSLRDTAFVISWHIAGMFAPGFITGHLIRRFGEVRMIMAGLVLEGLCIGVALSGIEVFDFWLAMLLLGVGWNFTFTAATSLMTTAYTPVERAKTQGMMNQIIYLCVMVGALSSGAFVHYFGWNWVNIGAAPLLLVAAGVTMWYATRMRTETVKA
jgi:MFS family permease